MAKVNIPEAFAHCISPAFGSVSKPESGQIRSPTESFKLKL
jgi:hypothetical protein